MLLNGLLGCVTDPLHGPKICFLVFLTDSVRVPLGSVKESNGADSERGKMRDTQHHNLISQSCTLPRHKIRLPISHKV